MGNKNDPRLSLPIKGYTATDDLWKFTATDDLARIVSADEGETI